MSSQTATFAGGCFWCTEAVYLLIPGVLGVRPGYAGGDVQHPTYEQVCGGRTGHAECIQVTFDPEKVSYTELLELFFLSHDPTTLNRQGADMGTQYRSAVFYDGEQQREAAEEARSKAQEHYTDPIVTEILQLKEFFFAEKYHQDYYNQHLDQPYCRVIIRPKVEKVKKTLQNR
jgi:peptide-methionine (S)-S-oxide reductase